MDIYFLLKFSFTTSDSFEAKVCIPKQQFSNFVIALIFWNFKDEDDSFIFFLNIIWVQRLSSFFEILQLVSGEMKSQQPQNLINCNNLFNI